MSRHLLLISLLLFSATSFASSWECIGRVIQCHTWRMEVPSGWIIAGDNSASTEHGYAMTFVPDADHKWKL